MREIPRPELLDPDRLLLDDRNDLSAEEHANRAATLAQALRESCAYAQQLWQNLDAVRGYLVDSLPSDSRTAGPRQRRSAAPAGPDDDEGWERWIEAYTAVTSVLAGPHGDSGFGSDEARREARDRRVALAPEPAGGGGHAMHQAGQSSRHRHAARGRRPLRVAARVALVLLAVRGLRRSSG
jgi:hypothetical protein